MNLNMKIGVMISDVLTNIFRCSRVFSRVGCLCIVMTLAMALSNVNVATAQNLRRSVKQTVSGGMLQDLPDTLWTDRDTVKLSKSDSLNRLKILAKQARQRQDSISRY